MKMMCNSCGKMFDCVLTGDMVCCSFCKTRYHVQLHPVMSATNTPPFELPKATASTLPPISVDAPPGHDNMKVVLPPVEHFNMDVVENTEPTELKESKTEKKPKHGHDTVAQL